MRIHRPYITFFRCGTLLLTVLFVLLHTPLFAEVSPDSQGDTESSQLKPPAEPTDKGGVGAAVEEEAPYAYMGRELRDPFTIPDIVGAGGRNKEDKETSILVQHALSDFRVVGIVRAENGYFAMISTEDGKGYTITVGTRIGPNEGFVKQITRDTVVVEETYLDLFNEPKRSETILALRPEELVP